MILLFLIQTYLFEGQKEKNINQRYNFGAQAAKCDQYVIMFVDCGSLCSGKGC